jgi:hypothetical protein
MDRNPTPRSCSSHEMVNKDDESYIHKFLGTHDKHMMRHNNQREEEALRLGGEVHDGYSKDLKIRN